MKHLNVISRHAEPAQAATSLLESAILLVVSAIFSQWDNYSAVYRNLSKYYEKT